MAKWARHPPSANRVKLGLAVLVICAGLFSIERWVGWPDWMTVEPPTRGSRVGH